MNPSTLNTILNSAPMVIQGASKLIRLIREQSESSEQRGDKKPDTIESLRAEIQLLEHKLAQTDESNIQQIQLIEQLAKQNEGLAQTLSNTQSRLRLLNLLVIISMVAALIALGLSLI